MVSWEVEAFRYVGRQAQAELAEIAKMEAERPKVKVTRDMIPPESCFPEEYREIYRVWMEEWGEQYLEFNLPNEGEVSDDVILDVIEVGFYDLLASKFDDMKSYEAESEPEDKEKFEPAPALKRSVLPLRDNPYPRPDLDNMSGQEWSLWSEAEKNRYYPLVTVQLTPDNLPPETHKLLKDYLEEYRLRKEQWAADKCYPSFAVPGNSVEEVIRAGEIVYFLSQDLLQLKMRRHREMAEMAMRAAGKTESDVLKSATENARKLGEQRRLERARAREERKLLEKNPESVVAAKRKYEELQRA